ncbi:hypothetical protein SNE40_006131 [Patella caerulea]|uniref:Tetraspanin n=1 Tax=Patella caerulea TaxID=87958 RepID=A0AAN8Q445_PATCE
MARNCFVRSVKYTLYFFNVFFFILGVASIAVGIYVLIDQSRLSTMTKLDSDATNPGLLVNGGIIFIATGALLVILSFIGCCGIMKEMKCVLALYVSLIGIIMLLQLTGFILVLVLRQQINESFEATLYQQLNTRYDNYYNSSDMFTIAYDYAMVYFECCGIKNYTEFKDRNRVSKWTHFNSQLIPAQCCKMDREMYFTENIPKLKVMSCPTTLRESNINKSCYNDIEAWVIERVKMMVIVAGIIVCIQFVGLILTCCFMRYLKEPNEKLISNKSFDERSDFDHRKHRKGINNRTGFNNRQHFDQRSDFDNRKPFSQPQLFNSRTPQTFYTGSSG